MTFTLWSNVCAPLLRQVALGKLEQVFGGALKVIEPGGIVLAPSVAEFATVEVHTPGAYGWIVRGDVSAAEAYARGLWSTPDLVNLLRIGARNISQVNTRMEDTWQKWCAPLIRLLRPAATRRRQTRRNISAHYDLGNDFFSLFLDAERAYSCAVYPHEHATLEQAVQHKFELILQHLALRDGEHFLDLGCGWGGLSIAAARWADCRVTALTLSREQYQFVCERVTQAGLADRITPVLTDYRDFTPPRRFDKIASIEMIEAVGPDNFNEYFTHLGRLLAPDGRALVQAIVLPESRYAEALGRSDFIQQSIFPGGGLPSREAMQRGAEAARLQPLDEHDITPHYARTLADWRARFLARLGEAQPLGFDERFCRTWEYYLCYCEAGFAERAIGTVQALYAGPDASINPQSG